MIYTFTEKAGLKQTKATPLAQMTLHLAVLVLGRRHT